MEYVFQISAFVGAKKSGAGCTLVHILLMWFMYWPLQDTMLILH